jgi:hypothetical protein
MTITLAMSLRPILCASSGLSAPMVSGSVVNDPNARLRASCINPSARSQARSVPMECSHCGEVTHRRDLIECLIENGVLEGIDRIHKSFSGARTIVMIYVIKKR